MEKPSMIRFRVSENPTKRWVWTSSRRWESEDDWIEPITHPALESTLITEGVRAAVIIRERSANVDVTYPWAGPSRTVEVSPEDYHAVLDDAKHWHLDRFILEISPDQGVRASSGVYNVAPVYLTATDHTLTGSWNLTDLARGCTPEDVIRYMVARTLSYFQRYSNRTHFRHIFHLTERSTAYLQNGDFRIEYPDDAQHAEPRPIREGADVVDGLTVLLESIIQERVLEPAICGLTLSGGMDSANVALTLGRLHPGAIAGSAILVAGAAGEQQRRRRRELARLAHLKSDITTPAMELPPLSAGSAILAGNSLDFDEEGFSEAVGHLIDLMVDEGIKVSFGGTGGDEMLALPPEERDFSGDLEDLTLPVWLTATARDELLSAESDIAPAAIINEVTLAGFACHNPLYIQRGVWPVEPLASPAAIRFGEWLPPEWRRRKRIFRDRLNRAGASNEVVNPRLSENLGGLMNLGVYRNCLPLLSRFLRTDLLLGQLGVVNVDRLRLAMEQASRSGEHQVDYRLYPVVATEVRLRHLAGLMTI
ncbi:hypothetical protein ACN27J_18320 [Solwaraspora sp. WMMB762]|uniref:hypothetical protein n=1 Tax=Solwaraspora sp. WMMB762 TaxID=3404120 RepID=UPI003B939A04